VIPLIRFAKLFCKFSYQHVVLIEKMHGFIHFFNQITSG